MMAELRRCENKHINAINTFLGWCMNLENVKVIITHSLVFNDDVECLLGDHWRVTLIQWVHIVVQVFHHIFKQKRNNACNIGSILQAQRYTSFLFLTLEKENLSVLVFLLHLQDIIKA